MNSKWSSALYGAALCYVALIFFRPGEVLPNLAGLRLVLAAAIVICPILAATWYERASLPLQLPHDRWLLAYWAAIGLSNVAAGSLEDAVGGLVEFAHVAFVYFLLRTAITTEKQFRGVVIVLIAAMLFHSVGGIVQYYTGVGLGGVPPYIERTARRSQSVGIFKDPNDYAIALVVALSFLGAGVFGRAVPSWHRLVAGVTALPILLAFYFANSRSAMLGLGASACVYSWRRLGPVHGSACAVVALAVLISLAPSRIAILVNHAEPSAQGRIHMWTAGLQMLKKRPITGVGWRQYTRYFPRPAHNAYLHALAELGLIGGGCFVATVFTFWWGLGQARRLNQRRIESLANAEHALASAGAGFFVGLFFLSSHHSVVTFTVLALGAIHLALVTPRPGAAVPAFGWRQYLMIAAATAALIAAIWIAVHLLVTGPVPPLLATHTAAIGRYR